jgi:LPXTG-site transpeptidase (sortase) family protein
MTIAPPTETAVADVIEVESPPPTPTRFDAASTRQVIIWAVVLVLIVALATVFFETLVTKKYYQVRQGQLFTAFKQPQPHLGIGDPAAVLQIPRTSSSLTSTQLNLNIVIVEGDGATQLHSAPGHQPGTPLPGRRGNSVIVGHRSAWGGPFADLAKLRKGAYLITQSHGARRAIVYQVTAVKHVSASDTRYFAPTKDFRLTLVTSDGGLLSTNRLIVQAVSGTSLAASRHRGPRVTVTHGSLLLNPAVAIAFGAIVLGGIAYDYLRRRYGLAALVVILAPVATAGLFALLLDLDLLLPPLR